MERIGPPAGPFSFSGRAQHGRVPYLRPMNIRSLARGNVGALALISMLNDTAADMIYPLLPLFLGARWGRGPRSSGWWRESPRASPA